METFAFEARRVISVPYAASLKNLDTALKRCDSEELRVWADAHPCQADILAPTVVSALEFCPYALSVAEHIACVGRIRDAMLCAKESLLDALLSSAMQDGNNFEKYSSVCLSLLSTPLPSDYPAPALLVQLFLKCVDNATKKPSVESIRAIYTLVSNGYRHLAELLTTAQRYNFHKQVGTFLTIQDRPDTNMLLILSLATLACMDAASNALVEEMSTAEQQKLGTAEFFHGKKALKVLGLVSNIVIDLVSRETIDWKVSIELIKMATVIVDNIGDSVKEQWPSSKDSVNTQRLLEKATKPGMDNRLVTEILKFASALHSGKQLQSLQVTVENLFLASYEQVKETGSVDTLFLPAALAEYFASSCSSSLITKILRSTLRLATSSGPFDVKTHRTLQDRVDFFENLNKLVPRMQNLRRGILSPLLTNEFSNHMRQFLSSPSTDVMCFQLCPQQGTCKAAIINSRNRLSATVCTLILRCAFYSQADATTSLDPSLATSLLEMQSQLSESKHKCALQSRAGLNPGTNRLSLFEASATPDVRITSRDWRHSLVVGMSREAAQQNEFVISAVGDICRDLERRCEGIEEPLREEQRKREELEKETENWKSKCVELEGDMERRRQLLEDLEGEKQRLENKLDGAIGRTQDCLDRIKELEDMLHSSREEIQKTREESEITSSTMATAHRNAMDELKSNAEKAAMEHLAVLNDRQNELGELEECKKRLEIQLAGVRDEFDALRQSKSKADERITKLDSARSELAFELECQKTVTTSNENKIDSLEKLLKEAEVERATLQKEIEELEATNTKLEQDLKNLREELNRAKEQADANLEKIRIEHNANTTRLRLGYENELQTLQSQLQETRTEASKERDALHTENRALSKKIHKLRAYQEEKEKEAQNLTRQLLSLMSGGGDLAHLLATNSNNDRNDLQGGAETPRPNQARTVRMSMPATVARRRPDAYDTSFESNATLPTPKRTKTRSGHRASVASGETQTKLGFKSAKAVHHENKQKRKAEEKENHEPLATAEIVEETPENEREDDEPTISDAETDYGGGTGLMFTSTPKLGLGHSITDTGRIAGGIGSDYDDTTMDF